MATTTTAGSKLEYDAGQLFDLYKRVRPHAHITPALLRNTLAAASSMQHSIECISTAWRMAGACIAALLARCQARPLCPTAIIITHAPAAAPAPAAHAPATQDQLVVHTIAPGLLQQRHEHIKDEKSMLCGTMIFYRGLHHSTKGHLPNSVARCVLAPAMCILCVCACGRG